MNTFRQPFCNEWPITQKYGEALISPFHTGIDYACPLGTNILASEDGTVMFAGMDRTGYGNTVIIQHSADRSTLYAHLSLICVSVGEKVRQGEKIGESGNTGHSTGPHLHFEARTQWNNYKSHFDPMLLPLMSVDDNIGAVKDEKPNGNRLTIPEKGVIMVTAPLGAYGHNDNFTWKTVFPRSSELPFTGNTKSYKGLTFCECTVWIAAHDGETQILQNVSKAE